jgi:molybdopterin converting factor small subunit
VSLTFVLHAHLARYAGGRERVEVAHRAGAAVADYLEQLGIPRHEFYAVAREGRVWTDLDAAPADGEVIELLPAMSGG